ncbi:hypothetical protein HUJ05_009372 [Dendroctonus ponderosae]|nr:hypothetical protein HUJ05_009372 [Dendroctonus ponderosae]
MSGVSVAVLCPNGRRQTVKCTPNTTILQVIEEVCKKQGLNAGDYDIKHHNKVLDTTTTFRFSGLPNNAQLELAAALKQRAEGNVTLAVNLEDGSRVTGGRLKRCNSPRVTCRFAGTFTPNATLMQVLNTVCPARALPDTHPVVVYTRREIYGRELENCTLRSLGLMGGRAMIRVLNRDPDLLREQANVSAPLPAKPAEEKPYIRKFQPVETQPEQTLPEGSATAHDYGQGQTLGGSEGMFPHSSTQEPKREKTQKKPPVDYLKLARERLKSPEGASGALNRDLGGMEVDAQTSIEQQKGIEEEFLFCGERHGMVFSLESAQAVPSEDLPDDFFALTIDDAKRILRDVKLSRHALENQELKTSRLRGLDEAKKQLRSLNKYKKAIIRVQFPNRTVVQGIFKPTETVQDVVEFVRSYLEDQTVDFYVYSTPPKCVLDNQSSLLEIGCVPGALLYFGADGKATGEFLKAELLSRFTTNSAASLAAARIRQENTRQLDYQQQQDDEILMETDDLPVNCGAGTSRDGEEAADPVPDRKLVSNAADYPRWFKPM